MKILINPHNSSPIGNIDPDFICTLYNGVPKEIIFAAFYTSDIQILEEHNEFIYKFKIYGL